MSDLRRRFVRGSVFLLPAFLAVAALHVYRGDLREWYSNVLTPSYHRAPHTYLIRGSRERVDRITKWTETVVKELENRHQAFGFRLPDKGFQIDIRREPGPSDWDEPLNRIIIRGVPDDAPAESVRPDLSRLIARAMLAAGAPPDAQLSPWFVEGVSTYFESTSESLGSRKEDLIRTAYFNRPETLERALASKPGPYFSAISHSIVAFLKLAYREPVIAEYAAVERKPGPVSPGEFERIFGREAEGKWRESLENR